MRYLFCLILLLSPLAWGRSQGTTTACKANLKSLSAALEMYASDHEGQYPDSLSELVVARYLSSLPNCPAAGADTYSANYVRVGEPDRFALCCAGDHHVRAMMPPNHPSCDSDGGLKHGLLDDASDNIGPCLHRLDEVGRAMRLYRREHRGHYPQNLEQLVPGYLDSLPQCPGGPLVLSKREGFWQVSCPASAHLRSGLAPFQPAWVENRTGLTRFVLQEVRWQPRVGPHDGRSDWAIGLGCLALASWGFARSLRLASF